MRRALFVKKLWPMSKDHFSLQIATVIMACHNRLKTHPYDLYISSLHPA
jgi:hypothetical protein